MNKRQWFRLSRFTHFYPLGEHIAAYNALNLALLFLPKDLAERIKAFDTGQEINEFLASFSEEERDEVRNTTQQMEGWQMLIPLGYDELSILQMVQQRLVHQPIGILYLLLTDQCNFACRYCFIEGGFVDASCQGFSMTPEVARQGIDLFARTMRNNPEGLQEEPYIILYGGEPLLNLETLQFVLEYARIQREKGELPNNTGVVLNTNASLVTPQVAQVLKEHNVAASVSLDGVQPLHDANRVFPSGKGTFAATMKGFETLKKFGVTTSVSCTISWDSVGQLKESLRWLVEDLGIRSLGFNIQRSSATIKVASPLEFVQKASEAIIECFRLAREMGVYEDRIMRKVNAFVNGQTYLNDCAGCGQQIVIAPTGEVGVCHGLLGSRQYFVAYDKSFDPHTHPYWTEWRRRSPLSMEQCAGCIALGICGGGCPQQALLEHGTIWGLDEIFCVHAKMTLEFLIKDLLEKMQKKS